MKTYTYTMPIQVTVTKELATQVEVVNELNLHIEASMHERRKWDDGSEFVVVYVDYAENE